ncbi:MAG: sulfotransferase family protein [Parahaliea sp.]
MGFVQKLDQYHDQAAALTGLDDFGEDDYLEPMKLVLEDYDRFNQFNPLGSSLVDAEMATRLAGRLLACDGFKRLGEQKPGELESPLFVIGTARSGTTATLRLLARDPGVQCLQYWLGAYPQVRPPRESWQDNVYFQRVTSGLQQADELVPSYHQIHPEEAEEPDEDRLVTEQSFWACAMASMATAPNYSEWCATADASYAYQYFKRVLCLIAGADSRPWVLKCPIHIWGLDSLLRVFPGARIVFTHRDPLTSISSTASMVYELRKIRQENVTPIQVGQEILTNWGRVLDKSEQVRRACPNARIIDITVDEIRLQPMQTIDRIYAYFGLELPASSRANIAAFCESDPTAGHSAHSYTPEDFGLSQGAVIEAIGSYWERNSNVRKESNIRLGI